MRDIAIYITKAYLYNFYPLKPHVYIVKVGYTENCLGDAVLTTTYNLCFSRNMKICDFFLSENLQFLAVNFSINLISRVFVMQKWTIYNIKIKIVPFVINFSTDYIIRY